MTRKPIPQDVQNKVLTVSRRRCCLCVFLAGKDIPVNGQLAHLNRDASDAKFENMVYLCLQHHDDYDTVRRQTKNLTLAEVRHWRDKLYERYSKKDAIEKGDIVEPRAGREYSSVSGYDAVIANPENHLDHLDDPWRFPLWLNGNEPVLFAYKAAFDGVCLIERINLPDGRIVVACIQVLGNPGTSITNAVESIVLQVCDRFDIPADKLVWLEHYEDLKPDEWRMVTFGTIPPKGNFDNPSWGTMTPAMWANLKLRPRKRLESEVGEYRSMLRKQFYWPNEAIESE